MLPPTPAISEEKHPRVLEPLMLVVLITVSILGSVVGIQMIVTLGISANTSIIGALIAIIISRIPVSLLKRFRSVHRQNQVQTAISSATFGAANSLFIPIGVPFAMGRPELIMPMLIGATLAMFLDGVMLYRMFGSKVFPASGTWPAGVATAESIIAGDQGGKKAMMLGGGLLVGVLGSMLHIPMSALGVAFIGNMWALLMFGIGLLIRGYATPVLGMDINKLFIPHGIMIGAGIVALVQVSASVMKNEGKHAVVEEDRKIVSVLGQGFVAFLLVSLIAALVAGLATEMSLPMFLGFLLFAAFAAYVHELIVGIAAMHAGWFPAFAVALITLVIGILIGFPPAALAILVGLSASTGPAFADMGYDLKTGYLLRGEGRDPELEREGRRQQLIAGMIGFAVSALCVLLVYDNFFARNLFPPVGKVYAVTIAAGVSKEIAMNLLIWAIPGALLQWVGGARRQLGVLMATGLLINVPAAGWAVLAGLLLRLFIVRRYKDAGETVCSTMAAGFIAGDALYNFFKPIFTSK
ncbi:OPT/YSL family transporter [Verminephrobacter eiseniae]|uniref:OPT/YSL family transporter n=1 Tax=Verminephrobacter eiseniae TaxID=364317 RepID=UPI0022382E91|nr:OPT/YSL family transporter [Verminephrobacter eiseniae]MCW5237518.1 OPT family oligopeptide transporter [Verminephrobacter eiseniae]